MLYEELIDGAGREGVGGITCLHKEPGDERSFNVGDIWRKQMQEFAESVRHCETGGSADLLSRGARRTVCSARRIRSNLRESLPEYIDIGLELTQLLADELLAPAR